MFIERDEGVKGMGGTAGVRRDASGQATKGQQQEQLLLEADVLASPAMLTALTEGETDCIEYPRGIEEKEREP